MFYFEKVSSKYCNEFLLLIIIEIKISSFSLVYHQHGLKKFFFLFGQPIWLSNIFLF